MKKISRFTVGKVCSGERAKGAARQTFAEKIRHVTPLKLLSRARNRDGVIQETSVGTLLSNGMNPHDIYGKLTRFLRILYEHKHFQLGLKGQTKGKRADF